MGRKKWRQTMIPVLVVVLALGKERAADQPQELVPTPDFGWPGEKLAKR